MKKCTIYRNIAIPAHNQAAGIRQPGKGSLHCPTSFVTPQFTAIVISSLLVVIAVGTNQLNAPRLHALSQRVAVISLVGDQAFGFCFWTTSAVTRYRNGLQRFLEERDLARGRSLQVVPQRNSLAVNHHHPLRALAPLGFPGAGAPFLAGAKLPSTKASLQSSCAFSSNSARNALQTSTQTPSSSQRLSLLQQVEGLGYSFGKSAHGAPVRNTHRIPSKILRLSAQGRPPFLPASSFGNNGSIFFHCSSVNFHRIFFLATGSYLLSMTKFTYCYALMQDRRAQILRL